jgi:hypothetical protein
MRYAPCPDSDFPAKELTPSEVEDAMEIAEAQRIDFLRSQGVLLDPDGFDSPDEIRRALGKTVGDEILR